MLSTPASGKRLRKGEGAACAEASNLAPLPRVGTEAWGRQKRLQKAVTSARYLCQVLGDQSGPSRAEDSGRFASAQGLREGLCLAARRDTWLPVPKWQRRHRGWALSQDPPRSRGRAPVQRALSTENGAHWSTPCLAQPPHTSKCRLVYGARAPLPAQGLGGVGLPTGTAGCWGHPVSLEYSETSLHQYYPEVAALPNPRGAGPGRGLRVLISGRCSWGRTQTRKEDRGQGMGTGTGLATF